jgi:hypothetical protein
MEISVDGRMVGSSSLADRFPAAVDGMSDLRDQVQPLIGDTIWVWEFREGRGEPVTGLFVKMELHYR